MKQINLNALLRDLNGIESWGKGIKPKRDINSQSSECHIYHTKFHSFRVIIEEKTTYSRIYPSIIEVPNQPVASYHLRLLKNKKVLQEHHGDKIKTLYETIDSKFK